MPLPPAYNPVYNLHVRLPEPSIHANPLIQTPPIPHLEGLHLIQWVMSDESQLSSSVRGDSLRFALKDHDSGKLIPHLPLPPMLGPFLLETLLGSKYQVLFHQPNVLLDGKPVGVFQWVVAPPWRCIELKLPLPKFLAAAGRASAARVAGKRLGAAAERVAAAAATPEQLAAAEKEKGEAEHEERQRSGLLGFEARQRSSRDAEQKALEEKREYDRLSRRGRQVAEQQDAEALVAADRAQRGTGSERAKALAVAQDRRAQAAVTRQGARALQEEAQAREKEAGARRKESQQERASWRRAEETRANAQKKAANPVQKATGESNAGLSAPSLFAHLPFPSTVEIQVSWSQIGKTWVAGLLGAAAEMLKYYVGFVFDGVLAPGKGKVATFLLDLLKSGINDTLIDGGAKYLVDGKWPLKISKKLGPVKLSASCEPDSVTGTHKWKVTLEHKSKKVGLGSTASKGSIEGHGWTPEKAGVEMGGRRLAEHTFSKPPVDYSHGVPTVN